MENQNSINNSLSLLKMKKSFIMLLSLSIMLILSSCSYTRVEEDVYTNTMLDTTFQHFVKNAPGNRDNGVIYPSSRTFNNEREMIQSDSIVTREYPDFIRLGLFESIGLLGSSSSNKIGTGLFGIFPDFQDIRSSYHGDKNALFSGGLYRIGIVENRLRWFHDSKNWTWGLSGLEIIAPNANTDETLISLVPFYIRKRYYLRDKIPYIAFTPSVGIGWFPSQYLNVSASLDIGSIGGLNLRVYAGFVGGVNMPFSPQVRNNPNKELRDNSVSTFFPYAGLGLSVLDFHNLVPETEAEWKDYEHSSWDVGFLQLGYLHTGANYSGLSSTANHLDSSNFLTGMIFKFANASIALPILDHKLYAGTSLINLYVFGQNEWGLGILPIRVGYWQTILTEELTTEPFIEYNYYPSSFINIGNRINLALSEDINFSFLIGYATGSTTLGIGKDFADEFGLPGDFSNLYIGISFNLADRIFKPKQLRYNKK